MPFNNVPFREQIPFDFRYSQPVDPIQYEHDDYLFNVRPRISRHAKVADDACWLIRDTWKNATGKEHPTAGCMDPIGGNWGAVAWPEAPDDRLFAVTLFNEFVFIQDDYIDVVEQDKINTIAEKWSWKTDEKPEEIKAMQAHVQSYILDTDPVAGAHFLKLIKEFIGVQANSRNFDWQNGTLEEYIEFRYSDVGTYFVCACTGFSVSPAIAPAEIEHVMEVTKIGYASAMLVNDYWSWEKEYRDFTGKDNWPVNAIYSVMRKNNVNADVAKAIVKVRIMELAQQYGEAALKCTAGLPLDSPVVKWFALHDMLFAGNAFWSMTCPRYHKDLPQQLRGDASLYTRLANFGLSPGELIVTEPYRYVSRLPGKGLRKEMLKALNSWYSLPVEPINRIEEVIDTLHNVSLLLDDVQDGSEVRRGKPATHITFSPSQTINSAGYMMMVCLENVLSLKDKACLDAYTEEVKDIYIGQALDLHWTYLSTPPTEQQYFRSIEQKTGGLLRLKARLVQSKYSSLPDTSINPTIVDLSEDINNLMILIGRYYQIGDDYKDVTSAMDPTLQTQCDLDQGNFTLPIIHLLRHQENSKSSELLSMFQARKEHGGMSPIMKLHIVDMLDKAGSLDYTKKVLEALHKDIMGKVAEIETKTGIENVLLRELMEKLQV